MPQYSEHNFNVIVITLAKGKIECIKVHVKKARYPNRRKTYDKTSSALSNKLPTVTISQLFISTRSHWSSIELYPRNNSTTESYGARSVFRLQFRSLIKVSIEKFKRYGKRRVIYIPPFRTAWKSPINLDFLEVETSRSPNNIVGTIL